jgi:aconitase A
MRTAEDMKYGIRVQAIASAMSFTWNVSGVPGKSLLLGSDSYTPAAGSLCMSAIGAGGIDVALAMAGEPYSTKRRWPG